MLLTFGLLTTLLAMRFASRRGEILSLHRQLRPRGRSNHALHADAEFPTLGQRKTGNTRPAKRPSFTDGARRR